MAEWDTALTTLAKVGVHLKAAVQDDARLNQLVAAVSASISQHCARKFAQADHTEYLDGDGCPSLWLRHWPATMPDTVSYGVWVSSAGVFDSAALLTERTLGSSTGTGDYILYGDEADQGRLVRLGTAGWPVGQRNVKIVYRGGYATIPEAVEQAATLWVVIAWHKARNSLDHVTAESLQAGGGSLTLVVEDMPKEVRLALLPWRRVGVAA